MMVGMWWPNAGQREAGDGGMGRILLPPYAVRRSSARGAEPAPVDGGSSRRMKYLAVPTRVYQVDTSSLKPTPASLCLACHGPPGFLRCTVARREAHCKHVTGFGVQHYTARQRPCFPRLKALSNSLGLDTPIHIRVGEAAILTTYQDSEKVRAS